VEDGTLFGGEYRLAVNGDLIHGRRPRIHLGVDDTRRFRNLNSTDSFVDDMAFF